MLCVRFTSTIHYIMCDGGFLKEKSIKRGGVICLLWFYKNRRIVFVNESSIVTLYVIHTLYVMYSFFDKRQKVISYK